MRIFGLLIAAMLALLAAAALTAWWTGWNLGGDFTDPRAPRLVWAASIGALLAVSIVGAARQRWAQTMFSMLAWSGAFLILVVAYSYRAELKVVWAKVRGEVFTSEAVMTAPGEVQLRRALDAHFYADANVNSATVTFMIDTGATQIALSWTDAKAVGIDPKLLKFGQKVLTAAGPAMVAPVTLAQLKVGSIVRTNVPAVVLPETVGGSLLGLTFLDTLTSYEIAGDRLTMRD